MQKSRWLSRGQGVQRRYNVPPGMSIEAFHVSILGHSPITFSLFPPLAGNAAAGHQSAAAALHRLQTTVSPNPSCHGEVKAKSSSC